MPNNLSPENIGKFQKLIAQNPVAFVASVFFIMFGVTYFMNVRKSNDAEEYWKELYLKERDKNDELQTQLLIKAGVLEKAKEAIIEADSTLKNKVSDKILKLDE
jgi:hypothetical protein